MSKEGGWQCCSSNEPFPSDMVVGGEDQHGNVIYVGRAPHAGDMIPAKVIPDRKAAYVCYAGVEIEKNNFEVLLSGKYEWKNGSNGSVPESALQVGQTNMGEPLYMGRAIYNGLLTPGKVHPSHSCCYLPCKGKEVSVTDYEVLCVRHNHCLEQELDTETLDASTDTDEEEGSWQCCSSNEPFPSDTDMVVGGEDKHGNVIYVGRAPHAGDMIPAKVIPDRKAAYVCYAGVEIEKNNFEVLLSGKYKWKNGSNGSVPESALQVGQTNMGEPLYIGRAIYNGLLTPGKVHPSHSCCYLPCKGKEVSVTDYEVLCIRRNHCYLRDLDTEILDSSTDTDEEEGSWQCCSSNEPFPSDTDMVVGGEDKHGNVIYVGRAPHAGDMIPAKVIPDRKAAYVCYAGVEIEKNNFEVLLSGKYEWKNGSNGSVPESALQVGQTNMGEPLYMGRAVYNGLLTPGKVHPSHSCCYLPCKGKEVSVTDYEVLCVRETLDASTDTDEEAYTIGVASHAGDMIPAKVIPGRKAAYVCYAGVGIAKNTFKVVLTEIYEWKNGSNGSVPESALQVGQTNMGEPLYMGRAIYNGLLTPGKVHPSHSCCYLPCKGKEVSVTDYEVLCTRHNHCLERELDTETLTASTSTDEKGIYEADVE